MNKYLARLSKARQEGRKEVGGGKKRERKREREEERSRVGGGRERICYFRKKHITTYSTDFFKQRMMT